MDKEKKKIPAQLNKFMHPRNPYKKCPPSFKELATLYPEFRTHCTYDITGKVFLDFKSADALRALTTCLLDKDFGLKVHIPHDRLVPTLPLRLNYLLWIEDLLSTIYPKYLKNKNEHRIIGLDIGTGASCIYPLLGVRKFQWKFLATETDDVSFESAKSNIDKNDLQDSILLLKESSLFDVLDMPSVCKFITDVNDVTENMEISGNSSFDCKGGMQDFAIDFTVCNPPFFSSDEELDTNHNSKKETRCSPSSISTGSLQEKVTDGGEIAFISRMVEMSILHRDKVKIFSTLIGKQSDVKKVVRIIKDQSGQSMLCVNVSTTEFCQGRTMRWGVAWTFRSEFSLDKISSQKKLMSQKPLVLTIPRSLVMSYNITFVWKNIVSWLKDIKIKPVVFKENTYFVGAIIKAYKPTWKNQRSKRREKERLSLTQTNKHTDALGPSKMLKRTQVENVEENEKDFSISHKKMKVNSSLSSNEEERESPISPKRLRHNSSLSLTEEGRSSTSPKRLRHNSSLSLTEEGRSPISPKRLRHNSSLSLTEEERDCYASPKRMRLDASLSSSENDSDLIFNKLSTSSSYTEDDCYTNGSNNQTATNLHNCETRNHQPHTSASNLSEPRNLQLESCCSPCTEAGASLPEDCDIDLKQLTIDNKIGTSSQESKAVIDAQSTSSHSIFNCEPTAISIHPKQLAKATEVPTGQKTEEFNCKNSDIKPTSELLLKCSIHVRQVSSVISVELSFIDGKGGKEAMNQLYQYLKNRMSQYL